MPQDDTNLLGEQVHMKRLRAASKPNLSFIILVSFLASFAVARVFTYFFPSTVLMVQGFHVHHFWYGLALLTIGGWLGINYRDNQTERIEP
jgi:predicted MFS family arabinose efflux permease